MSAIMSEAGPVELDDVQGLVRFAYKHLTEASFLLLRVNDAAAARAWLAQAPITTAAKVDPLPAIPCTRKRRSATGGRRRKRTTKDGLRLRLRGERSTR